MSVYIYIHTFIAFIKYALVLTIIINEHKRQKPNFQTIDAYFVNNNTWKLYTCNWYKDQII